MLDLIFQNTEKLFSEAKGKMISEISDYDFKNWNIFNTPAWVIEAISTKARVGLSDTFSGNAMKVTGMDIGYFLVDTKVTHIPIYVRLLASLITRTIYQDNIEIRFSDFQDFLGSIQYSSSQIILGKFCIYNYVESLSNYIKDKGLYSSVIDENIRLIVDTNDYHCLIHGFGNTNFV